MNQIVLSGRLTRDPEIKEFGKHTLIKFTVAVRRRRKKEGDQDYLTDFFDCTAWGSHVEIINKHFSKGEVISVAGELQIRDYEGRDGVKRKGIDVQVDNFWFPQSNSKREQSWHEQLGATPASEVVGTSETFLDEPDDQQLPFDF